MFSPNSKDGSNTFSESCTTRAKIVNIRPTIKELNFEIICKENVGFQLADDKGKGKEYIEGYRAGYDQAKSGINTNITNILDAEKDMDESYYDGYLAGYYYSKLLLESD